MQLQLHCAAVEGYLDCVHFILKYRADRNMADRNIADLRGWYSLHHAIVLLIVGLVNILLLLNI